jgi:hypothetical protein
MMGRDKLLALRKRVKAGEVLERDQVLAIIDHGVASWVEMLGGESAVARRAELAERERQIKLALTDLRTELETFNASLVELVGTALVEGGYSVEKPLYILDCIIKMLSAKGPTWKREWAWYRPSVDEEFSP